MNTGRAAISEATATLLRTDPGQIYGRAVLAHLPRLLGQIDRNSHSPTYGSCCRNFWHYRIEDISNSQVQEVVLTLAQAYSIGADWNPYARSPQLRRWIEAILRYWASLQRPSGSFDEVYRGQDSYAATAFTSYCASEAALILREDLDESVITTVNKTLERAVSWLVTTNERMACNQIAGATATMVNAYRLSGDEKHRHAARQSVELLKSLQTDEGWFNEYGGADIGYSSLTLDYLIKIWCATGWEDVLLMGERLLEFFSYFVHRDGTAGGVHGSRNTEYVVPHGIELLAPRNPVAMSLSNLLLTTIAQRPERTVLNRLDDRYLCYLSGFFMQAAATAVARDDHTISLPCTRPHERYFAESGLWSVGNETYHLVANAAKGGALRTDFHTGESFQDGGIFVTQADGPVYTTQALQPSLDVKVSAGRVELRAPLVKLSPITVSPWRMLLFKTYNLLVPGYLRRLALDLIRKRAVSSGSPLGHDLRTIQIGTDKVEVQDRLKLPEGSFRLCIPLLTERAFSFASSGFFHPAEVEQSTSLPWENQIQGPGEPVLPRTLTRAGWTTGQGQP